MTCPYDCVNRATKCVVVPLSMTHNVQAIGLMELACISEAYGKGWLASRSGPAHLPYNGVADDNGTSSCPLLWYGMMPREPAHVPSRGVG